MTPGAAAIERDAENRSYLLWRRAEPLFRMAVKLLPSLRVRSDASPFDLYLAAAVVAVLDGEVPDGLPRSLDAARALTGSVDDWGRGTFGDRTTVGHWAVELIDNNPDLTVDFELPENVYRCALSGQWAQQSWFSSEVCRRRAVAMLLERWLLHEIGPCYYPADAELQTRHARQIVRQILWLLSPSSGMTLLFREHTQGLAVRDLAILCGVSQSTITLWKRGGAVPRPGRFGQLSAALDVGVADLAAAAQDRVPTGWLLERGERFPA